MHQPLTAFEQVATNIRSLLAADDVCKCGFSHPIFRIPDASTPYTSPSSDSKLRQIFSVEIRLTC